MVLVGLICMWFGGWAMRLLVGFVTVLMIWELVRMLAPQAALAGWIAGGIGGVAVMAIPSLTGLAACVVICLVLIALVLCAPQRWKIAVGYGLVLTLGAATLILMRDQLGFGWLLWLVVLVVATDVAGYFAGKTFGGAKFWPSISPKKTWSGTTAGWIAAGLVGLVSGIGSGVMAPVIALSLLLSFAGQLGDIAESAIKRLCGVKDSSDLIPGHGGVLDRFDALLGASAGLLIIAALTGFPQGLL